MYLNCKTYFSFRYGTFSTEGLVKAGVEVGATALALTNINSTCDAWDFVQYCRKANVKPILGAEIRNGDQLLYILIAANNKGFTWINKFLSGHLLEKKLFPEAISEPFFDGYVIYPFNKAKEKLFDNEFIGVLPAEVNKLHGMDSSFKKKLVIRQPVTFQSKGYYNVHRLLRAIDNNVLLSKLANETVCSPAEYFEKPSELLQAFEQYPDIVTNTYTHSLNVSVKADVILILSNEL